MAANRPTRHAPQSLTSISKTSLVDVVWELAGVAPGCESCDDPKQILRVIREALLQVGAPTSDVRFAERAMERAALKEAERGGAR